MNFRIFSAGFIISLALSSCTSSFKNIVIETSHPSAQMLPDGIKSLTLIDRATTSDFSRYNVKETQQYFFDRNFNVNAVMLDSLASDTTLKALGQLLYESGCDVVIPEDRFYPHESKYYEMSAPLNWAKVDEICSDYNTDALLALERYYTKISTTYNTYDGQYAVATIQSIYNVVADVYYPKERKIVQQIIVNDTISWKQEGMSTEEIFKQLPPVTSCVTQSAIQVALDIDGKISPQWKRENRIFFILDRDEESEGAKIIDLANNQEWLSLYDYWLAIEKKATKSIKYKAQFNLALASEMLGSIDDALSWIEKSLKTKYTQQARNYMDTLLKRKSQLEALSTR